MGQIYGTASLHRAPDDGSDRERVTSSMASTARKPSFYVAPLLDESTCPILGIPTNSLEKILSQVSLKDLTRVSQTCKYLNVAVGEFLRHQCSAAESLIKHHDFTRRLGHLATLSERRILEDININVSGDDDEESKLSRVARYKLLHHTKIVEQMNHERISVCDESVHFPHRGNESYIVSRESPSLGRQIVTVREVCWLEIRHAFPVTPGTYSVSIRVRIDTQRFRWPHRDTDATLFSVVYPSPSSSTGQDSLVVSVYKPWWMRLKQQGAALITQGLDVTWEVVRPGERRDWFMVTLDPVTLTEAGDLVFQMKDVDCPWWKSGLSFDFLQLTRH